MFAAKDRSARDAAVCSHLGSVTPTSRVSSNYCEKQQMLPPARRGETFSFTGNNLSKMNTYAQCATKPCRMRTSKIIGLKVPCNEHLRKKWGEGDPKQSA